MSSEYLSNVLIAISVTFVSAGAGMLLLFEFSLYAFILLSLLTIASFMISVLAVLADKAEEKKRKLLNKIIIVCGAVFCFLLLCLTITGKNKMSNSIERFTRNVEESTEYNIISMEESTTFSGNIFCLNTNDYYIVMQEAENGGYLKKKYPCDSTILFETDDEPYAKTIKVYKEDVLVAKEKQFLPAGNVLGENVEHRWLIDIQYEIHIPKGTLQGYPSTDMQLKEEQQ